MSKREKIRQLKKKLWKVYKPKIEKKLRKLWLKNAKHPFPFFRAFVPFFYRIVDDAPRRKLQGLKDLEKHRGQVAGDPHPRNFGAVWVRGNSPKKSVILTANDPDDGWGDGRLYQDFLRFLVGVRLVPESPNPVRALKKAYLDGLSNDDTDLLTKSLKMPGPVKKAWKALARKEKNLEKRDYRRLFERERKKAKKKDADYRKLRKNRDAVV